MGSGEVYILITISRFLLSTNVGYSLFSTVLAVLLLLLSYYRYHYHYHYPC